jgi:hypothetical protein
LNTSAASGPSSELASRLARVREQLHHLPEQRAHTPGRLRGPAEQGHEFAPRHAARHGLDRLFARDVPTFEVVLEQRFVGGGERLL